MSVQTYLRSGGTRLACMHLPEVTGTQGYSWSLTQVSHPNKGYVNVEQHNSYWLAIQH